MNQLVGLWRQYNPDDARGDDEITSTLAQQFPEQFTKFPDAVEDYGRIQKEVAEATKPTAGDYVKQGAGELLRGIPSALLTEPVEAMDVAARALQRKLPLPGVGVDSEFPFVHYKSPSEETESLQSGEGVLARTAELSKDLTDKFTPEPVEGLQDNFLASTVPRTAGSIAGFMAGGGIAKALTKGAVKAVVEAAGEDALKEAAEAGFSKQYQNYVKDRAEKAVHSYAAGVLGAGSQAYGAYEDAKAKGASDDDAMKAYLANLPVGAAYALPIHELLPGGETGSKLGRIARDVGIGTGTMGAQQVASNLIAKGLYDPNRDLMAGVGEGAGAGAIVTAGLSALSHGLMGSQGAKKGERPTSNSELPTSNQEPTSSAEPVEPASPIDPVQQYEASPESVAKVQDVLQRQAAGETGPAIESALAGIYADPDLHALYTQEANSQATELKDKVDEAAAAADPAPTEAQKEAGNYQKGHVSIDGLDITIENAKGSTRSGTDADGKAWSVEMPAHYGYVKGTEGNDGDHVDVYIGEHPDSQKVWVVDQKDAQTGKFDEHKALLGFSNIHEAGMAYAKAFSDGKAKQRVGGVTELTMEQFKDWLKAGDHSKPLKEISKPITPPTSAPAPSVEVQARAPVDPKPKISGPENGVGAPGSYPDGGPTQSGQWEKLRGKPEELPGKLAFESAQVASKEGGLGKKSAPAFVETADPKELYKDKTADANDRSKSRKLGVFMSPDGSHVLVGTAYENGGKQYVTAFDANGKPKATQIGKLTEAGYRLVAALKTKEPTKGYAVTYSAPEWAKASEELRAKAGEVRSGGVAPVPEAVATELVGSSESRGGSVVKSPNASPYEMRGGAGKVEPELLGKLVDAIGEPRWDNQEEAHEQITDGFSELTVAQQTKLLDAFSPKDGRSGEVDYVEGFERLKESLYEHFKSEPAKEAVTNPVDTGAEKWRVPNPATVPAAGVGDTNAGPGGGQPSGAGSGAGTQGGANTSERLSQRSARGGVSSSPELRARWNSVLDAARANGLDVAVLQAIPGMREGGVWRPGEAVLTVVDALNPSHDNIVLALHELAGHPVFDRLPEAQKQMMYRAFDAMAGQATMPEGFTPKIADGANVREVTAEEVLVERASRSLAAEGFDPASARGIAQRVVRMLKTIALRAYMGLQKATLGYVTPELAQSYFEERMRSFLSDGPAPMSFLSWMGGPKLKVEQRAETFSARGGSGALAASFDYERGSLAIREVLPETVSAMQFNSAVAADDKARFSDRGPAGTAFVQTNDPHVISRDLNSPEKVKEDVGAYNALHDAHQAAFKAFGKLDKSGLSFEQFVSAFTNSDGPATEKIEARNKELQANGFEPVDPTLRPHDLLSEASQMQAADKGLQYLWSLREHWSTRRKESESFLKGAQETLSRNNQRLHELLKRYTDMDLQFSNARDELKGIHGEWVRDLKAGIGNGRKEGVLSQVIRELDGSPALPKQYERVINRLYSQLTGDNTGKFVDTLQRIAQLDIDWKNVKARDAAELIAKMVAPTDPSLKQLENRGMAGLVVAFAKSNEHVMEFLKIARSDAMEERAKLNEILKGAVSDARDAVTKAKELVRKLPRLAVSADRLLTKLEELKAQNHAHIDEMQRARTFIDLHTDALPGLQDGMVQLERMIGAKGLSWEPNDGAKYLVALPGRGNGPVFSEKVLKLAGVEGSDEVRQAVVANNAWLNSVPEDKRGADWNSLREMTTKLEQVSALAGHELVVKRSVVNTFTGSLVDKLESLGLPTAKAAAMRMRRYLAERHAGGADADVLGGKWKSAEGKAMEALGLKGAGEEKFQRLVFQSALSFAEKNPHLLAQFRDGKAAFDALLPKLRDYLARDPDMAQRLNNPGAWPALENYYRRTYESMEYVNNFRKKLGAKIRETGPDGFSIEREPIGSTFFTAMRRISKDAVRMYHDMRDIGWLGTEQGKLTADRVAKDYAADRDGFEQQVQQLFTPDVWREFVQPLVETDGRASFCGPKGVDGLTPLALRENVKRAFAAAEGSPVKFAEALYELESYPDRASPDGASVEEGQPEFVGRTMQAFQEFFDSIHNTQKDYDNNLRQGMPTPGRVLQDARISESWPGAWMDYQTYGRFEMHEMVNALAAHGSFGRDLAGMRKDMAATESALARKAEVFRKIANEVTDANPGKKGAGLQRLIQQAVQRQGHSYMDLKQSARNLQSARYEHRQFEALMKSQGGLALELQPFTELVGAIAGATVQGPGTALVHFGNFGQQFQKLGLGGAAMSVLRSSLKGFAAEQFGTLAQLFHGQIAWNAERNARRVRNGYVDPDARRKFEDAWAGMVHDRVSALNPMLRGVFKAARAVRTLTSTGLGRAAEGSDNAYPTLKPQALFTQLAQHMSAGFIDGWTSGFEDMVERAVKYFQDPAHAGDHADPAFRFENMTDLGYTKGFMGIGNDERAFKYFYDALGRYGMSLEKVARDVTAARERDPKAPALNDDQFRVLASVVANEVTLDANPATRPSAIYTNPLLRVSAPLLGWSVAKTHDNWEAFRNPDMTQTSRNAFKAFTTGLLPYTALVPIGIALGLMRDKYNEVVLNKKANREDPTSFGGVVDSLSWVGNLGLAGDVFNSLLNRDTQRPFDADNRVLFLSSLIGAKNALQNWYEQGSADYATVYRPLTQALGGSGYLQYWQILNNAMSLDNVEARVTARINVSNFLRVAGRELGMDVKGTAGAGEVMSTPMRPLIGQMVMSAYANDSGTFREAYMQALALARGMKEPDPQKYIAQKFGGYNPLKSVFKTEPSTLEYQKLLNTLDPDGQLAVSNALRMFNAYATQIGGRASFGTEKKVTPFVAARMGERQAFNLQDARRMATSY